MSLKWSSKKWNKAVKQHFQSLYCTLCFLVSLQLLIFNSVITGNKSLLRNAKRLTFKALFWFVLSRFSILYSHTVFFWLWFNTIIITYLAYPILINLLVPLIFLHLTWKKTKGNKFTQYRCAKNKEAQKVFCWVEARILKGEYQMPLSRPKLTF